MSNNSGFMGKITLRKVKKVDWDFILELRNNPDFKTFFYDQHKITKREHYAYLKLQKNNKNFFNWIILLDNIKIGYVRILNNDVSIMVDPQYHGKNIGTKALKLLEGEAKKLKIKKLIGRVMLYNKKSAKIFEKNGYKLLMYWYEKKL